MPRSQHERGGHPRPQRDVRGIRRARARTGAGRDRRARERPRRLAQAARRARARPNPARTSSSWRTRSPQSRRRTASTPAGVGGTRTAPGMRSASSRRSHADGDRVRMSRLRRADRRRGSQTGSPTTRPALPLPRPRRSLVGRHRLHLKHDESLPVGGAHSPLARPARAGSDDLGLEAGRARTGVVEDRFSPKWQPHTREQNAAILERLGLTGEFWRLP